MWSTLDFSFRFWFRVVTLYKNSSKQQKLDPVFFFFPKMNSLDGLQEYQFIIPLPRYKYLVKYSNQYHDEFSYHLVVLQQYVFPPQAEPEIAI